MPPRLAHRKSRKGCARCKERKVKCDEIHPACSACLRHGVACDYGSNQSTPRESATGNGLKIPSASPASLSHSPLSGQLHGPESPYSVHSLDVTEDDRRLIELFLLQRYLACIAPAFPASQSVALKHHYSVDFLDQAFHHSFLLNGIFAISSLHVIITQNQLSRPTYKQPSNPEPMIDIPATLKHVDFTLVHRVYITAAIQEQRKALAELNGTNANAIGLSSIILSVIVTSLPEEIAQDGQHYAPPIRWLRMSNAITPVLGAAKDFVAPDATIMQIMATKDPDFRDAGFIWDPANLIPFRHLLDFDDPYETGRTPEVQAAQTRTLIYIGSIYRAIQNGEETYKICRRIMTFAALAPREFIASLENRQARSLVIFAHYTAIIKRVEEFWFYRGVAEREVYGIQSILSSNWQWALKWPLEQLIMPELTP